MSGGQMAIAMDPPSADNATSKACSVLTISPSTTRRSSNARSRTAAHRRAATPSTSPTCASTSPACPGRVALHDGVVRGPILGGTIDGLVDYARDDVHLRGTLVPLYGAKQSARPAAAARVSSSAAKKRGWSASPTKWSASRAIRCCTSIRCRRWRPGLLRKMFEFPGKPVTAPAADDATGAVDGTISNNH